MSKKEAQFQNLENTQKQIFEILKEEENAEYSQICFDVLFSEFTKQVQELEKAGIQEFEIQKRLSNKYAAKDADTIANLAKFYDRFVKSGKKEVGQPN